MKIKLGKNGFKTIPFLHECFLGWKFNDNRIYFKNKLEKLDINGRIEWCSLGRGIGTFAWIIYCLG